MSPTFTTTQVLEMFSRHSFKLTRDLLYFWEKRKWIVPQREAPRDNGQRRYYSQEDINKISILLDCYQEGHTPERSWDMARKSIQLPSERLNSLAVATEKLTGALGPEQEVLNLTARCIEEVMRCESAALFLFRETSLNERTVRNTHQSARSQLYLVANSIVGKPEPYGGCFALSEDPGRGLTGWIASQGKASNLSGSELRDHPAARKTGAPEHLPSKKCCSLLMWPLQDRKQRTLGWIKVENRIGTSQSPSDFAVFDKIDEAILQILAKQIVTSLEVLFVMQASHDLLEGMPRTRDLRSFGEKTLDSAIQLLGLDRGDFAWVDGDTLKLLAYQGPIDSPKRLHAPVHPASLTSQVFTRKKSLIVNKAQDDPSYRSCWDKTRSEALVPLLRNEQCVGVMNVESCKEDFFDERDMEFLRHLSTHIVPAAEMIESRHAYFSQLLAPFSGHRSAHSKPYAQDEMLTSILTSVRQGLGFDGGLIYVADFNSSRLRCAATMPETLHDPDFAFDFASRSFATNIFETRGPLFVESPYEDDRVEKEGLKKFHIMGPMVGVPLLYGDTAVGVMLVWGVTSSSPKASDQETLKRYAQLAVTTITMFDATAKRKAMISGMQTVLELIQTGASTRQVLHAILRSLNKVGFDRSRVFKLERQGNQEVFVCLDSAGREHDGFFEGVSISLSESEYARMTRDSWLQRDIKPRVRYPEETGPDQACERLRKPVDLPWAVAPLAVGGLFGYLAVDQAVKREPLTETDLETLGLFATLAAHAIASDQISSMIQSDILQSGKVESSTVPSSAIQSPRAAKA